MNRKHREILEHTLKVTWYCGDSKEMQELCSMGLMQYAGRKSFVPDPYFTLTDMGKKLLKEAT